MTDDLGLAGFDQVEEIGRGAFGVVYRARQVDLDRVVAIKVLTGSFDEQAQSRFDRERRAMGAVSSHGNIVAVHASGFTEHGRPYILMDYATAGSLADRLAREGPLPWADAIAVGAKLADALAAAHAAGVLHRDVKPENVLLSAYGEPMLADFGIARMAGGPETRTGVVTASIAQAAPEIIDGKRPTEQSDVYSLASTIYALITGQAPFVRDTDESIIPVLARAATEPPPDLRPRGVPDAVCRVLEQDLSKTPDERETASQFARSLRAAATASATPGAALPTGTVTISVPPPPPSASDAASPIMPAEPPTTPSTPAPPSPPPVEPAAAGAAEHGSHRRALVAAGIGAAIVLVGAGAFLALSGGGKEKASTTTDVTSTTTSKAAADAAARRASKSFAVKTEAILDESATGRGKVGPIVRDVLSGCTLSPVAGAESMGEVIDNRTSVLNEIAGLPTAPDATAAAYQALLKSAVQSSISADTDYRDWMNFVASSSGCGTNPVATNDAFQNAQLADSASTALKTQFTTAFNAVATQFGLKTWAPGDF